MSLLTTEGRILHALRGTMNGRTIPEICRAVRLQPDDVAPVVRRLVEAGRLVARPIHCRGVVLPAFHDARWIFSRNRQSRSAQAGKGQPRRKTSARRNSDEPL